eukprot:310872_1
MATQEMQDYDESVHNILLDMFREHVKGKTFTREKNTVDNCSLDCQTFMDEMTNIATEFESLTSNIDKKSKGLQTRNDVYCDEETKTDIAYGEMLCAAKGVEKTALSYSKYGYYWRDSFQDNDLSRPPDTFYDPQRNIQSFAVLLRDPRFQTQDLRFFDKTYQIKRNTRLNYFAFMQLCPRTDPNPNIPQTPFKMRGHMMILFNVCYYPICYNVQSGEVYGNVQKFIHDKKIQKLTNSIHLYILQNNVYLKSKIMSPKAFDIRSDNILALSKIYFKFHKNQLLEKFLQDNYPKHLCIYYAILWGEDDATILSEHFGIEVTRLDVSDWLQMGDDFNADDPKILKLKKSLDTVYDIIKTDGIQSLTQNQIDSQIQFLGNHFRAAMHMDPVGMDTSTYMIHATEYSAEHTKIRRHLKTIALASELTNKFKSDIKYIKKLNDKMGFIFNKKK